MATPSQGLILCKGCGVKDVPHKVHKLFCGACAKAKQVEYQRQFRERQKELAKPVICKGCGDCFDTGKTGRSWRCPACLLKYQQEYAAMDKERHAGYSRNYRAKMGDAYRDKMQKRRGAMLAQMTPLQQAEFRAKEAAKSMRLNAKLREEVFASYGGFRCACCGETERLFLTIDHVENDGAEMRKNGTHSRGGTQFYQWLRKNKFPAGFQVLCMNCNSGKHRNGGTCPHKSLKV